MTDKIRPALIAWNKYVRELGREADHDEMYDWCMTNKKEFGYPSNGSFFQCLRKAVIEHNTPLKLKVKKIKKEKRGKRVYYSEGTGKRKRLMEKYGFGVTPRQQELQKLLSELKLK